MPANIPSDFETYSQAKDRRDHRVRILRFGDADSKCLAANMAVCDNEFSCDSDACPICDGLFRRQLCRRGVPILEARQTWTRASVVTAGLLVPYDQLAAINLDQLMKRIHKRLDRSTLRYRMIIGGIDISLNLEDNEIIGWQLHLYLLIEGENDQALREAIKAAFPPEPTAPEPYQFKTVGDFAKAVTYAYKSTFYRRSRYRKNGKPQTRSQSLKPPDLRILLPFLHRFSIGTRLILRGVRRDGKNLISTKRGK
jgi:hypothetical protein